MSRHAHKLTICVAGAQLMLGSSAAMATAQTPLDQEEITVLGKSPPELRKEARDYVQELGIAIGETPAARWIDPVCPSAVGVSAKVSALVEAQVRHVAQQVGAPLADEKCKANLLVVFTENAPELVKTIAKRSRLGDMSFEMKKSLQTAEVPVRWWYSHEVRGADGMPEINVLSPALKIIGMDGAASDVNNTFLTGKAITNSVTASSVGTSSTRAIRHATVVVDVRRAEGKPLASIVDFAAFVGLAEIKLDASPPNSILDLFGASPVTRLSKNDTAMLKGLYSMPLARTADQHRRSLVTNIIKTRLDPKRESQD